MPFFAYKGRNARGELMQGVLEGADSGAVADQLFGTGVTPLDITPTTRKATTPANGGGAGESLWERLTRQFSTEVSTEWAYNLQFGCERCATDADLLLFAAIIAGRRDEAVWRQLVTMTDRCVCSERPSQQPAHRPGAGGAGLGDNIQYFGCGGLSGVRAHAQEALTATLSLFPFVTAAAIQPAIESLLPAPVRGWRLCNCERGGEVGWRLLQAGRE